MQEITKEMVLKALSGVIDPDLNRDIVALNFVNADRVTIEGDVVKATVVLTTPACPVKDRLQAECVALIEGIPGVTRADVTMTANTASRDRAGDDKKAMLPGVRNIIAVGSGKGGVGKSTVAANLAYALRRSGASVGLLDADIYGPSVAILMGVRGQTPQITPEHKMLPLERYGMKCISMGVLIKDNDAVMWRGPMLGKVLQQFVGDVDWGELDYLIIDLPPGTGDVQLSLAQMLPIDGAVVVTTPQDVAFSDVRRALKMCEATHVPVLGLVENMSYFVCPDNGKTYYIFGKGRTAQHANDLGLELLGTLPIDPQIGPAADRGELIAINDPDGEQTGLYAEIAGKIAAALSKRHLAKEKKKSLKGFFKVMGK